MSLNNYVTPDREDRPLTRADIEQRIQNVGGSNRLDVSGQNLEAIDFSGANLNKADLSGASLSGMLITAESKEDLLQAIGVQWSTE